MRKIAVSEFKARCLGLLHEGATTGEPIVDDQARWPIAQVTSLEHSAPLEGSVTFLVDDHELLATRLRLSACEQLVEGK